MKPFDSLGTFWIPGRDDTRQAGQLSFGYGREGITLSLAKPLEADANFADFAHGHDDYPVIFGVLRSGELVTLAECSVLVGLAFGGMAQINLTLKPAFLFKGDHLPEGAASEFDGFAAHFDHFDAWAAPNEPVLEPEDGLLGPVYRRHEDRRIECGAFGGIVAVSGFTNISSVQTSFTFKRGAVIEYTAPSPLPCREFLDAVIKPLQYFLTFASGRSVYPGSIDFLVEGTGRQVGARWVPTPLPMAYAGWHAPSDEDSRTPMRLPLRYIGTRLGDLLTRWHALHIEQEQAMDLFFSISLGFELYLETRFLLVVQAVELYHRRRWRDGVKPEAEHDARIAAILEDTPTAHRRWLKGKLKHSNEPTLAERINRLCGHAGPEIDTVVRSTLAETSANTRNYLTHYTAKLKDKAAKEEDLLYLSWELTALMELCLFADLGFESSRALQLCALTPMFRALLQRRGSPFPPLPGVEVNAESDGEAAVPPLGETS